MRSAMALGGAAALLLSWGTAPAAQAGPAADTFQGVWTGVDNCGVSAPDVSGSWTVVTKADGSAVVHLTIFLEQGRLHAAWGGAATGIALTAQDPGDDVFDVTGGPLTFVLDQDGHLTYTIAGYCSGGGSAYGYGDLTH